MPVEESDAASRAELVEAIDGLVDEYRDRALWFLRQDFYPASDDERLRTLEYIARRSNLATYRRVAELRECLLRSCSGKSAA